MRLVSSVLLDMGAFPLSLPVPDGINNGGFLLPTINGSGPAYSPIDLLVAGLEASRLGIEISDLPAFFCLDRIILSEHKVHLAIEVHDKIHYESIAYWKDYIRANDHKNMLTIFNCNAPLTFKWVKL